MNKNYLILLIIVFTIAACKKDDSQPEEKNELPGKWKRHITGTYLDFQLRPMAYDITYELQFGETSFYSKEDYYDELIEDTTVNNRRILILNGTYNFRGDRLIKTDITSATNNGQTTINHIGQKYYIYKSTGDSISFIDCNQWKRISGNTDQLLNSSFYNMTISHVNEVTIYNHHKIEFSSDSVDHGYVSNSSADLPATWMSQPFFETKVTVYDEHFEYNDWGNEKHTYVFYNGDLYIGGFGKNYIKE